ncbi:MAG: hypothetical protein VX938_04485, partial [Myxococcota bacterium]|nr:hypothetical protein [Myxococcota bacterium]
MSRFGGVWAVLGVMGLALTVMPACSDDEPAGDPGACTSDSDCDDGSPCTVDVCKTGGVCELVPQPGESCDDADACTVGEACDADGACTGGEAVDLTSGPCEVCTCDATDGVMCHPRNPGDSCDDGNCCTLSDTCKTCDPSTDEGCGEAGVMCGGVDKDCGDENTCTDDVCSCDDLGVASCG